MGKTGIDATKTINDELTRHCCFISRRNVDMTSNDLPNQKRSTSMLPLMLTPAEIESLRQDLQQASDWAKQMLAQRKIKIRN